MSPIRKPTLVIQTAEQSRQTGGWEAVHKRLKENVLLNRYIGSLEWEFRDGLLVLTGCLPSFYLKQVLQTALQNLPGTSRVDNQVLVADSRDLNSITCVRDLLK